MSKYVTWDDIDESDGGEAAYGKKRSATTPDEAALRHARANTESPIARVFVRDVKRNTVGIYTVKHEVSVVWTGCIA